MWTGLLQAELGELAGWVTRGGAVRHFLSCTRRLTFVSCSVLLQAQSLQSQRHNSNSSSGLSAGSYALNRSVTVPQQQVPPSPQPQPQRPADGTFAGAAGDFSAWSFGPLSPVLADCGTGPSQLFRNKPPPQHEVVLGA